MRKLMWFTLGFGTACALCAYLWITADLWRFALTALILCVICFCCSIWSKNLRIAAIIMLGCTFGFTWFQVFADYYLSPAAKLDGSTESVSVLCSDYSYQTEYGIAAEGLVHHCGKPYRTKMYIDTDTSLEPGDILTGRFRFRVTTRDGEDSPTSHPGKGTFLLAYAEDTIEVTKQEEKPFIVFPALLRHALLRIVDRSFPTDTAPFAKALLLGDRSGLDYKTNTALKVSGISHVVAVSGLHVMILFSLINAVCFRRRALVAAVGIPTLALFASIAGFSPSIVRACVMQGLMILAMLFDKEYDGPTELAFACIIMMAVNPLVITSVSFQLSVGCVAGIMLFQSRIYNWMCGKLGCGKNKRLQRGKRWLCRSVSVTLSAMTLTTPLVAYYFDTVSLIGVLTNLLTLWAISFIFYGIIAVCLTGWFWSEAGLLTAWIVAWPIRYVLLLSKSLAAFPLAAVYTKSIWIVIWLVFVYVSLAVFLCRKNRKPAVLICSIILGLCAALSVSWIEPMGDSCRMTVLNVGQGQSILLQSDGKTYLIDCGGSNDTKSADLSAETLLSLGISRLDGVILTHFDRDHSGGMEYLLTRVSTDSIFFPDCQDEDGLISKLNAVSPAEFFKVRETVRISYGDSEIMVFGPVLPDSSNESSLAVLFRHKKCDILITGDRGEFGERMLLKQADIPDIDVLVAGHHGSKYSTTEALLEAASPETVIISVGENPFGHPAKQTLERLDLYECTVLRTDIHGDIIIRR